MHILLHTFKSFANLLRTACLVLCYGMAIALPALPSSAVAATTGLPSVASSQPLPTAQVDGIVYAQVVIGNTVYATGNFTHARAAGVALGGASVPRQNLVAYDINTGVLNTTFHPSLGGTGTVQGRALAASPDGKRLYVGGTFTTAGGVARNNFAAFDLTTLNAAATQQPPISAFATGTNGTVRSIATNGTTVYLGGTFTTAGGQTHNRLAAYNTAGVIQGSWNPSVTTTSTAALSAGVWGIVAVPSANNLVIGGYFNRINGNLYNATGAVKLDSGAPVSPWASSNPAFPLRDQLIAGAPAGISTGVSSLSTDGSQVYLTSQNTAGTYGDGGGFEGRAALNPVNGAIIWANDCRGDSYSAFPIGQVLYSVSHAHDCKAIGGFVQTNPMTYHRALAETTFPTGTNAFGSDNGLFPEFTGLPRGSLLNWYPSLTDIGTSGQAAWSVSGNANYVVVGGDFKTAGSIRQQSLVRYAIAPTALRSLELANGSRCLDAYGPGNGGLTTPVELWDCNGGINQQWQFNSNGTIQLVHNGGRCLDANGTGNGANATNVWLWDCNGGPNQQWVRYPDGSIALLNGGRCLDANGAANGANGLQLWLWDCNNGINQHWFSLPL